MITGFFKTAYYEKLPPPRGGIKPVFYLVGTYLKQVPA